MSDAPTLTPLPFVGRSDELARLRSVLDRTEGGQASSFLLRGPGGVGKTRLARALGDDASRRGWTVAAGQAFPVGSGSPYGLFSDALVPVVRALDPGALSVLTRGSEDDLHRLFPELGPATRARTPEGGPQELKMRSFWNLAELLRGLAGRSPLLLVLEDLQWADEPSLELLHFLVRETREHAVLVVGTYNDQLRHEQPALGRTEQSLSRLGLLDVRPLGPLSKRDLTALTHELFGLDAGMGAPFVERLHEWTGGNPFFVEETLQALVDTGQLAFRDGLWVGFDTGRMELPGSVREAVRARLGELEPAAVAVAQVAAVLGNRASHPVLERAAQLPAADLLAGIDALRGRNILDERVEDGAVVYAFAHPLVREAVVSDLGHARSRALHQRVAEALEAVLGAQAPAEALAYHLARSGDEHAVEKEVRFLASAGRDAFERHAYPQAADFLGQALERLQSRPDAADAVDLDRLREDHAWALAATGEMSEAIRALEHLEADGSDPERTARILRRTVRAYYWNGRPVEALARADAALPQLAAGTAAAARMHLLRGLCLERLGRPDEAGAAFEAALKEARSLGDGALEGRAEQALALLSLWTGRPEPARAHGSRALELSRANEAATVEFWSLWVQAALEGLTGNPAGLLAHVEEARAVASRLGSPHLRLWAAELLIEHAAATGEWDRGLTIGEQAVELASNLGHHAVLPRLDIWTALIYVGRGELDRSKELIDHAWALAVENAPAAGMDVHAAVPAHTGRAAWLLAAGQPDEAVRVAQAGLEIADRSGYFIWAVHRLLPVLAEAHIVRGDLEGARSVGARLRRDAERLGHHLALAWADACDGLVQWKEGDTEGSVQSLRQSAEALEQVPFVWDAARLRRQLAGRLVELGREDEARQELRGVHDVLAHLGAQQELDKAREMFREFGARPPARTPAAGSGAGALTPREAEIARLVAERKSNKAIAKALGISPRTVSTHLSNIFKKVEVGSRGELTDLVRTTLLPPE